MTGFVQEFAGQALGLLEAAASGKAPLLAALFAAGLVGGASHCAGMCGPFVLAQVSAGLERIPAEAMSQLTRLKGAALLPYHLGRLTTYTVLGTVAAGVTGEVVSLTGFRWLAAALLAAAAAVFLLQGLSRGAGRLAAPGRSPGGGGGRLADALSRLAGPLFPDGGSGGGLKGYGLGVVLGFLPCGLLYGAVAAAASAGNALVGALVMVSFSLGTVPGLIGVGLVGHYVMGQSRSLVRTLATALMLINAGVLGYLAWRTVA